ncbi:MAG TPA: hypothetical protein VF594_07305 [Rubricoccaceae bacterium]|jgi:hypothetical protein
MSDDVLTPLRRAYGVEVPGSDAAGAASGSSAQAETALLVQTRAAVEMAVAGMDRQPPAATLAAVLARAALASDTSFAPLAAVRALYGEPAGTVHLAEAALLSQSRAAIESTFGAQTLSPSAAALAAVLDRAAEATQRAPEPDAPIAVPVLAPLAVAYGLPLAPQIEAPATAETALLVQTRALLDGRPAGAGPSEAAISAILARATDAVPAQAAPVQAAPAPLQSMPERPAPAADRSPLPAARRGRRVGVWASAAAVAVALVFALMPRPTSAPEVPPATEAGLVASSLAEVTPENDPAPTAESATAEPAMADATGLTGPSADRVVVQPAAPVATAPPPVAAPAIAAQRTPTPRVEARSAPAAVSRVPAPPPARPSVSRASAPDATTALVAADVTPSADGAWDAPENVRVLSLRLQDLGRGTANLGWDEPAEAFGVPATSGQSMQGLHSVRETVPAARARLLTVPGD